MPVSFFKHTNISIFSVHWVVRVCKLLFQVWIYEQIWFVCPVAFPSITAPLAGLIPNKRRDQMNQFFINTIQKIIKQREEQPPEQVDLT